MHALESLAQAMPALLTLYWFLCTGAATVALLPLPFLSGFRAAVILSACRGKLVDLKPPKAFGCLSNWMVPQKWFLHFYSIGAVCALAALATVLSQAQDPATKTAVVALSLFEIHLVRRALETMFLMRYPPHATMHGIAYVYGLSYYLVVPLTLLPAKSLQKLVATPDAAIALNPTLRSCAQLWGELSSAVQSLHGSQLLGIAVFLCGNVLQLYSHYLLAKLASKRNRNSSNTYRIPRGSLFELVSCPHYFSEIVVYAGLAMLAGRSTPLIIVAFCWVVVNLILAASMTQMWYRRHFKTYPPKRKVLIPWVY